MIAPSQECLNLFHDFEQQSSGRGLSVIPSRYVLSRYVHSLKACQRDSALLWMTSQLGTVHQSKSWSRPLAIWMNEFAERHVTDVCDLGDVVVDHIEKLFEILEKFSASTSAATATGAGGGVGSGSSSAASPLSWNNTNNTGAIEKDLLRITNDLHRKLMRIINAVYQGEAIFQRIPSIGAAGSVSTSSLSGGLTSSTLQQMQGARGFMGDVLDKIGDTMVDALGGWSQLLTEVKQMNQLLKATTSSSQQQQQQQHAKQQVSKADQNMRLIATLVSNALASSLKSILIAGMNKLPASLGEDVIDDTYQNVIATVEEFLTTAGSSD